MHCSVPVAAAIAALYVSVSARPVEAQETRSFFYGNFLCTARTPYPSVTRTSERYYHEVVDGGKIRHQVCAKVDAFSALAQLPVERRVRAPVQRKCETFDLVSHTIRCQGGSVSAAQFFMAADTDHRIQDGRGPFKITGNTLFAPIYGSIWRPPDSYVPLPEGYGFFAGISGDRAQLTLPWTALATGTAFAAAAIVPPPYVPAWLQFFSRAWPWPQLALALPLVLFAALAFIGLKTSENPNMGAMPMLVVCAIALFALSSLRLPPDGVHRNAVDANRVTSSIETVRFLPGSSMLEPFSQAQLRHVQKHLADRNKSQEQPRPFGAALFIPSLFFVLLYGVAAVRGWHYLFVAHPASPVIGPPLRSGALFAKQRLAHALSPNPGELFAPPPAYQSRNMQSKSESLKDKISADARIADAAMRRDRARAEQLRAKAELRELRKSLTWWQRWFG
jgi:hypothetical protein